MQALIVLVVIVASCSGNLYTLNENRVIGGSNAGVGQYPFQVSLLTNDSHYCGGTILNEKWVLTAAHCIYFVSPNETTVLAGTNYLDSNNGTRFSVSKGIMHKDFDINRTGNDTGVLKINGTFNFSIPFIKPVRLASNYVWGSENVTGIGWGYSDLNGTLPNALQHLNLSTLSHNLCSSILPVSTSEICAQAKFNQSICNGDSGSALILTENNQQVGITSWGVGCASGNPDVYTRISNFTTWIYNNTDSWNTTYSIDGDYELNEANQDTSIDV